MTDNFEHRAEYTQEILSRKPGFMERWAAGLLLIIVLLLTVGAGFIRYPDIIVLHGTLVPAQSPQEIISYQKGRLIRLFVKNGELVRKGRIICWIESTASTADVLALSAMLDSSLVLIARQCDERIPGLFLGPPRNFGTLQAPYQAFILTLLQFCPKPVKDSAFQSKGSVKERILFEQALQTLKSDVDEWLHHYVIRAAEDGKVSFTVPLQENQFISQEKVLGYIDIPDTGYYVQVDLPQDYLAKISTGMPVHLRFPAYSYRETGFLSGSLEYISPIADERGSIGTVRLVNGLKTNLGNLIPYRRGLRADALVTVKNTSLLQRIGTNFMYPASRGK